MTGGYFPLFRRFLESSIMDEELPVRFVWLTMLLKAGRDGIVHATPKAIARTANIPLADTEAALAVLQMPDENSTSEDDEGRRIKELSPNRWLLINYEEYRKRAQADRDRVLNAAAAKRYRETLRGLPGALGEASLVDSLTDDDRHGPSPSVMEPHDGVMDSASGLGSVLGVMNTEGESEGESKTEKPKKKAKRFVRPTVEHILAYLQEKGETRIDPKDFSDFYESKGWVVGKAPMKDWKAAVRTWIRQRDRDGVKQRVGVRSDQAPTEAMKERSRRLKHILKHSNALLQLDGMTDDQRIRIRASAQLLSALAESDMPKGLMEEEFYKIHDTMMLELYDGLEEEDQAALSADVPSGSVNWIRKELQTRFEIPDPLEYDFDPADVPA